MVFQIDSMSGTVFIAAFKKGWVFAILLIGLALGCRSNKGDQEAQTPQAQVNTNLTYTPVTSPQGTIKHINKLGRFVVIEFPGATLPQPDQRVFVYRNNLKVGELRISTFKEDTHCVADIVAGDPQLQDEVREN
jgi:hypothetical protein